MQKYKSHKVVEAAQIKVAEFRADGSGCVIVVGSEPIQERMFDVPAGFKRPNTAPVMNPDGGDYLVRYESGYMSWSPKDVFEAGYTPVNALFSEQCEFPHTAETSKAWMDTAVQHHRNEQFYHGIVTQVGELLGPAAKTSDDGTVQDGVLALKVAGLVKELLDKLNQCGGNFHLYAGLDYYAEGGWNDFSGKFDTLEAAAARGKELVRPVGSYNWWHVVDLATGKAVLGINGGHCGSLPEGAAAAS